MVFFTACHYDRVPGQAGTAQHAQAIAAIDSQWRGGFYVVTGLAPSTRASLERAMSEVHNSRLPILARDA